MPTITRKIELHLCTEGLSEEQQKEQRLLLYHINDNLYKAANNVSSKLCAQGDCPRVHGILIFQTPHEKAEAARTSVFCFILLE